MPLEIFFKDNKLKAFCEQRDVAIKKVGAVCARKLRTRLADMLAVNAVSELTAGNPHPLHGERAGQFALDLEGGFRLVFEPAHDPAPRKIDGGIDWAKISRVRIIFIGDYHE